LLSPAELLAELQGPDAAQHRPAVMVHLGLDAPDPPNGVIERMGSLPLVVVGVTAGDGPREDWRALCDVVVEEGDPTLERVLENLETRPQASTALALLMRGQAHRTVGEGLVAESATYSLLQGGPEFAAWRANRPQRPPGNSGPRVRVERRDNTLLITLTRSDRLNALDSRMRDELLEGLAIAEVDPAITGIELRGEGAAFCAGGDLDEFGSRPDPATAHLVRLRRSIGRTMATLAARTTVHLHGHCIGSGIELAAFADRVIARRDTAISLPEIGLGLIPGAGGTVSLTHRVGRLRTAWLALSGCTIDAETAHSWGLVDSVIE
jgi:hypothetical protein